MNVGGAGWGLVQSSHWSVGLVCGQCRCLEMLGAACMLAMLVRAVSLHLGQGVVACFLNFVDLMHCLWGVV